MKKFFYLLLATVFAFTFVACSDDDDDAVNLPAATVVGDYDVDFSVVSKVNPTDTLIVGSDVLKITAGEGNTVNAVIPSMTYKVMHMTIPALDVKGIKVEAKADGSKELSISKFAGHDNTGNKDYTVTFNGNVKADKSYGFTADVKYGRMPMILSVTYKPAQK